MILWSCILALTFLVPQIWDIGCEGNGYTIYVPAEVTAQVGLCVHLPCRFTVPDDVTISREAKGFWYRPFNAPKELVASNKDSPRRRMFFTGSVSGRDCSLLINDIEEKDENIYHFRLEDSIGYNYFNVIPHLRVTELTDKPEISVGKLFAGEPATVTCRSPGICAGSAPAFTWSRKDGNVSNFKNTYANYTSVYFSNINFTPSKEDNGLPLVCKVAFLQLSAEKVRGAETEQRVNLNVEYPPDVIITIAASAADGDFPFPVKEGDTKMINCTVDSNPIAEITWFVGGEVKKGPTDGRSLIYSLNNISLSDAGKYLCLGKNDHGNSTRTIDIIVHYAPRTPNIICPTTKDCSIDAQRMIYVMESSAISLLCTAQSLPEASVSWVTSGPSNNQTGVNGHLALPYVSLSNEGEFTCVANNSYGKSMSSVNIKVTYKPRMVPGIISGCRGHGGGVVCACITQSFPTANIQWNIDETLYPSNHSDQELHIVTLTSNALTNSTLTLNASRMNIRCMSSNRHGRLDLLLLGYAQSSFNPQIIAAISCVVVIVLLLIGGLLVMHYFRKKKLAMKTEDKKEISGDDRNVIYSNSEVHVYGNQMAETNMVDTAEDDRDNSMYMNVEDVQYATISFSMLRSKHIPEDIEVEYAEIKK